jgi:hypothetical protein
LDTTGFTGTTWQEHRTCAWTWPSVYGVTGCVDHDEVFETPSGDEAWGVLPEVTSPAVPSLSTKTKGGAW